MGCRRSISTEESGRKSKMKPAEAGFVLGEQGRQES
jgi:hypothetical protein